MINSGSLEEIPVMHDVFTVADVLVSHAVENYGEDVDLIAYYGSQARGEARKDSDLDIFYTPAEGKNPPLGRTFLLDGVLYDFWAIRWETLEGFATGRLRGWSFAPALVREAKTLYVRSPAQASRLAELKQRSYDLEKRDSRPEMVNRSLKAFTRVTHRLGMLRVACGDGEPADVRFAAWHLIEGVWECLALVNQVTFPSGFGGALSGNGTEALTDRPKKLREHISVLANSSDVNAVLRAADELVRETHLVIRNREDPIPAEGTIREAFGEAYPEMKDMIRKLLSACDKGDRVTAGLEAYHLQSDVTKILSQTRDRPSWGDFALYTEAASAYREAGLPDLMMLSSGPLDRLADGARLFDERLRTWLRKHSADLCEFRTIEELKRSL